MSKAEKYQEELNQIECIYDARPEDIISSLRFLVEDMIEVIRELEESNSKEYQAKKIKLEASVRTGIN